MKTFLKIFKAICMITLFAFLPVFIIFENNNTILIIFQCWVGLLIITMIYFWATGKIELIKNNKK